MNNSEKFKEVFGFELNPEPYKNDIYCPFNSTKCGDLPCDDCIKTFWQSEYKEPKTDVEIVICQDLNCEKCKYVHRCDYGKGLIKDAQHGRNAMKRLVEINNAKWQKAIEAIKKEIESEQKGYDKWLETALDIIDKHTKELM